MIGKYVLFPEKEEFLRALEKLDVTSDEFLQVEQITLTQVEVDENARSWAIHYQEPERKANANLLAAVAKKLAAACCLKTVGFIPEQVEEKVEAPNQVEVITQDNCVVLKNPTKIASKTKGDGPTLIYGKTFAKKPIPLVKITEEENNVVVEGQLVTVEDKELRTGSIILRLGIKDATEGLLVKMRVGEVDYKNKKDPAEFLASNRVEVKKLKEILEVGSTIRLFGSISVDRFENNDLVMDRVRSIMRIPVEKRMDKAPQKRVELHCHTMMSKMDAITPIPKLVEQALRWGHKALAITDHGVVQAFPFAQQALKNALMKANKKAKAAGAEPVEPLKLIFGLEGYLWSGVEGDKTYHVIILVKNSTGLYNLYKLISLSHLRFYGGKRARPRIPKELLNEYREGLIVGSACAAGEIFQAILDGKSEEELEELAAFYDYLEIQPIGNNNYLIRSDKYPKINSEDDLIGFNKRIYELATKLGKMTVATCDVHFLDPEDYILRAIMQAGQSYADADEQAPLYLRTTEEMLAEFSYFSPEIAEEIVVTNTNKIAAQVEAIEPVPSSEFLYSPVIPGAEKKITEMSYAKAESMYGSPLPEIVEARLKQELDSIVGHGFSVLYYIAHMLVKKSNDDGYMVGSRGSVGSSFVATLTNITEVNPLEPHYRCPQCRHSEFITDGSYSSGFDLPPKACPGCGTMMIRDGQTIPFAVFMGFNGDKVPDIDLNFSGEYQPVAHKYTEDLFGHDNVFRAGTLGTLAEKTAYGYVRKYYEGKGQSVRPAFINGMVPGLVGVKRTTGQHPGGIMVIPRDLDVHYITPVQHPADNPKSDIITTHFDYHSINDRLVKLDILGHDDPTVIKMLETILNIDTKELPIGDPETISIFSSTTALGVTEEQIGSKVGTYGIPECGTKFVREMLYDVQPKKFSDLLRVSGYSHGTDVWLNNAQELIHSGVPSEETISTRDDIMTYLINHGLDRLMAFKIMEKCRKGKGTDEEQTNAMKAAKISEQYIASCNKVKYLFPKAHATAYVLIAYRIAYCKVHYPEAFYAAYFSIRAPKFDYILVSKGKEFMKRYIKYVYEKVSAPTEVEKDTVTYMELAVEMLERGFKFVPVDLYKSDAHRFVITPDGLLPPLGSIGGIGETAADSIVEARKDGVFTSQEDLRTRAKLTQAIIDTLNEANVLGNMPESNQMVLF